MLKNLPDVVEKPVRTAGHSPLMSGAPLERVNKCLRKIAIATYLSFRDQEKSENILAIVGVDEN